MSRRDISEILLDFIYISQIKKIKNIFTNPAHAQESGT